MSRRFDAFFVPADTVFVGPPSSAPAGESHHMEGLFPPPATTWQGVVRSAVLGATRDLPPLNDGTRRDRIEKLVGPPHALPPGWSIDGPWVAGPARDDGRLLPWLPTPAWLVRSREHLEIARPLRGDREGGTISGGSQPARAGGDAERHTEGDRQVPRFLDTAEVVPVGVPGRSRIAPARGWIRADALAGLLAGTIPTNDPFTLARDLPPVVRREVRAGVAVEENKRAKDGMLYFLETTRFVEGAGLLGGLEAPLSADTPDDALQKGMLPLGRKGRWLLGQTLPPLHPGWEELKAGAWLDEAGDWAWVGLVNAALLGERERLRPDFGAALPAGLGEVHLDVVAAWLTEDVVLGGARIHGVDRMSIQPNRPWVGAGSAWLLRLRGGDKAARAAALRALHFHCVLGEARLRAFGAGRVVVGLCPPPTGA